MKNQTPYARGGGCGKHTPEYTLYDLDGERLCLDCYSTNAPMTPAPEATDKEQDKEQDKERDKEREILLGFLRIAANEANWGPQNQTGELRVWHPYPPLHVTARRLLEEMDHD